MTSYCTCRLCERTCAEERARVRKSQRAVLAAMRKHKPSLAGWVALLDASTRPRKP